MQSLQEIFNRIQVAKSKQRELKKMYKDALAASPEYQSNTEEMNRLREERKKIENGIKESFKDEIGLLDGLKISLESDAQILSDVALSQLVGGEKVEVVDKDDNKYEPLFNVKLRKTNNLNR